MTMTKQDARDPQAFVSFVDLRAAHTDLLRQKAPGSPSAADIVAFLRRGVETGTLLPGSSDRWEAQTLLDYWLTTLDRMDITPPDATLRPFDPERAPELPDDLCPYLGLEPFKPDQHKLFFGRERLTDSLIATLRDHQFLPILGQSGSGKSSVVMAGLLPALKRGAIGDSATWHFLPPVVPGADPLETLARLARGGEAQSAEWLATNASEMRRDKRHLARLLGDVAKTTAVVVVDQFEEVFTLCANDGDRTAFIDSLLHLADIEAPRHRVVITMRTDFEASVVKFERLRKRFETAARRLTPLTPKEMRDAIIRPAERVSLEFEEGLADEIANDIADEVAALPLLQFTLLKLWDARERNRVTTTAYRRLGGARTALAVSADEFYRRQIQQNQETIRFILLRLVRPAEGTEFTSSRVQRLTLTKGGPPAERVEENLNRLIHQRLVRVTHGDVPDGTEDRVEVAHEALIRNWPTFIDWLTEERYRRRHRGQLTAAAERWITSGRPKDLLFRGTLLEEARSFDDFTETERTFIRASRSRERRDRRRTTYLVVLFFAVLLGAVVVSTIQWRTAERYADKLGVLSEVQTDIVRSALYSVEDPQLSLALLERSETIRDSAGLNAMLPEGSASVLDNATTALLDNALLAFSMERGRASPEQVGRIFGFDYGASVSVAADGRLAVVGARFTRRRNAAYPHLFVLDPSAPERPLGIAASTLGLDSMRTVSVLARLSPEDASGNELLAIASLDHVVSFYEIDRVACVAGDRDRCVRRTLDEHFLGTKAQPVSMAWDGTGRRLAVGDLKGNIRVFDTIDLRSYDWVLPAESKLHVAFVANSDALLLAGNGSVYLWRDLSQQPERLDVTIPGEVLALAGAPRALRFTVATEGGELVLLDMDGEPRSRTLAPAVPGAGQITWSPDGQYFAAGGADRVVHIWSAEGSVVATSPVFDGAVNDLSWLTAADAGAVKKLVVTGNFDPYDENGWDRKAGGHIEIVDVSYLFEDLRGKRDRVRGVLENLDPDELLQRCQRLVGDDSVCNSLRGWTGVGRSQDIEEVR